MPAPRMLPAVCLALTACSQTPDTDDAGSASEPSPERWRAIEREIRERFPKVRQLSIEQFARERGDGTLVIDVRAPAEFAVSRIPGARNVPLDSGVATGLSDTPRDAEIVLYCSVGWRSSMAADELRRAGYTNVANLEGSVFAWANESRPLEDDSGSTDVVHPYDADWGKLLRPDRRAPLGR